MSAARVTLPSPGILFGADFLERLGRLAVRVVSVLDRNEGAGRGALLGGGTEFVGFRPYRPGEDLRRLDWNLFARMRRPFVRVARREASEHWSVLLDTSASMGVGTPGKLQAAAEVATAIAAVGHRRGAEVELFASGDGASFRLGKRADIAALMRFLEGVRADGERGLARLVGEPGRFRRAGLVVLVGDLVDLEPREALSLARRGRELHCVQILADEELRPQPGRSVRWVDAETGAQRAMVLDGAVVAAYETILSRRVEAWGRACALHRARFGSWSSAEPFESVVTELFEE